MSEDLEKDFEYEFQGLHFNSVTPSLNYRYKSNLFFDKINSFLEVYSKTERLTLLSLYPSLTEFLKGLGDSASVDFLSQSKEFVKENKDVEAKNLLSEVQEFVMKKVKNLPIEALEFYDAYLKYLNKKKEGRDRFFENIDNIKELFEIYLVGEINKINYNIGTDEEIIKFDKFKDEIVEDFFLSRKTQKK